MMTPDQIPTSKSDDALLANLNRHRTLLAERDTEITHLNEIIVLLHKRIAEAGISDDEKQSSYEPRPR